MQGVESEIPECGGEQVTHRWGNCFSPGRCLLFSRKMPTTVLKYIQAQKSLQLLPHISPQCLPLHTLPLADSSPLCPPFVGAQGEFLWTSSMCFGPFKKKKKNSGFVFSGIHLFLGDKNPVVFPHWMLWGWPILALALWAWEPVLGYRLHSHWERGTPIAVL